MRRTVTVRNVVYRGGKVKYWTIRNNLHRYVYVFTPVSNNITERRGWYIGRPVRQRICYYLGLTLVS